MYIGLQVKYPFFVSDFNEFSRKIFRKYSNIKFHENPSSGSTVVPCGRTEMTKLTVACRNFANEPNKKIIERERGRNLQKMSVCASKIQVMGPYKYLDRFKYKTLSSIE
jgi:hypothetical protein